MPQSLVQIYLHIIFATKNRKRYLQDKTLRDQTHAYLVGACKNQGVEAIRIGGVEDHVHICCRMSKTLAVADLIAELKRESSKWIQSQDRRLGDSTGNQAKERSPSVHRMLMGWSNTSPTKKSITSENHSKTSSDACARSTGWKSMNDMCGIGHNTAKITYAEGVRFQSPG